MTRFRQFDKKAVGAAANFGFTNRHITALLVRRSFNRMFGPIPVKLVYDVTHNYDARLD